MKRIIKMLNIGLILILGVFAMSCDNGNGGVDLSGDIFITPRTNARVGTELTVIYRGDEDVNFQWRMGNTNVGTGEKFTPEQPGNYTVIVSASGFKNKISDIVEIGEIVNYARWPIGFVFGYTTVPEDIGEDEDIEVKVGQWGDYGTLFDSTYPVSISFRNDDIKNIATLNVTYYKSGNSYSFKVISVENNKIDLKCISSSDTSVWRIDDPFTISNFEFKIGIYEEWSTLDTLFLIFSGDSGFGDITFFMSGGSGIIIQDWKLTECPYEIFN
ncbi:MAG: hypothetical protein LBC80_00035 [Treponema sp.]|jgi:hypothetical protein|nr:hypothetical protein [Treponema sp.]